VEEAAHSSTILQTHTAPIPQTVAVAVAMIYQMCREIISFEICNARRRDIHSNDNNDDDTKRLAPTTLCELKPSSRLRS
jgi:hypothetical protein